MRRLSASCFGIFSTGWRHRPASRQLASYRTLRQSERPAGQPDAQQDDESANDHRQRDGFSQEDRSPNHAEGGGQIRGGNRPCRTDIANQAKEEEVCDPGTSDTQRENG